MASTLSGVRRVKASEDTQHTRHGRKECIALGYNSVPQFSFISKGQGRDVSSAGLFLKCLQQPGLGQAETMNQEFCKGLSHCCQKPKYLAHHLLLPRSISRKLCQKHGEAEVQTRCSDMESGHNKWCHNY